MGTRLESISNNHLALTCDLCGHTSLVSVRDLIQRLGKQTTIHDVTPRVRCGKCKAKGKASFVITYIGGSGTAMLGARTQTEK